MGEPTEIQAGSVSGQAGTHPPPDGTTRATAPRGASVRRRVAAQRRSPARPRLWFELALIGVSYWLYSIIRNAVPEQAQIAMRNAHWVWSVERAAGIGAERAINHAADSVTWLIIGMDYYYATLHFIMTIGVLVWLYHSHPGRYAAARTALFVTTGLALLGFYFFPLAPPRLMSRTFVDTVLVHHTWGSLASGAASHVSNQYAAMPSMHIGWSLWCGVTIFFLAHRTWVKALGLAYPTATLIVIISTANHFWMDAVAGALCLLIGLTAARLVYHVWVFQLPRVPDAAAPHRRVTLPAQLGAPVGVGRP